MTFRMSKHITHCPNTIGIVNDVCLCFIINFAFSSQKSENVDVHEHCQYVSPSVRPSAYQLINQNVRSVLDRCVFDELNVEKTAKKRVRKVEQPRAMYTRQAKNQRNNWNVVLNLILISDFWIFNNKAIVIIISSRLKSFSKKKYYNSHFVTIYITQRTIKYRVSLLEDFWLAVTFWQMFSIFNTWCLVNCVVS